MRSATVLLFAVLLVGCASTLTSEFEGLAIPSGSNVAVARLPAAPDSARVVVAHALHQAGYEVQAEGGALRTALRPAGSGVLLALYADIQAAASGSVVEVRGYWRPGGLRGRLVRFVEPGDDSVEQAQWSYMDRPYSYAFGRVAELVASFPGSSVTYVQEREE